MLKKLYKSKLVRFGVVGSVGFLVNATFLFLFHGKAGLNLILSQFMAAELAILSNFGFHYHWTFNDRKGSILKKLGQYHLSSWSGFVINFVVLLFCVYVLKIFYLFGLAIGSLVAMSWNFLWSYFKIWMKDEQS